MSLHSEFTRDEKYNKVSLLVIGFLFAFFSALILIPMMVWQEDDSLGYHHSPRAMYNNTFGSGHAFGTNVPYVVDQKVTLNGTNWAIISSELSGEEDVQIWSQDPEILSLDQGTQFRFSNNGRVVASAPTNG